MSENQIKKPKRKLLSIVHLRIDPTVQRERNDTRVRQMARAFQEHALGTVVASLRDDGEYYIIDGQHRVAAALAAGRDDVMIWAEVYEGLTLQREAMLFRERNTTKPPTYPDKFNIAVVEGEPEAVGIKDILDFHGWSVKKSNASGVIAASEALRRQWRRSPDSLRMTMQVITVAWGMNTKRAVDGHMIEGVGVIFARDGKTVDINRMIKTLEGLKPNEVVETAIAGARMFKMKAPALVAQAIIDAYNAHKRTGRLDSWVESTALG